MSETQTRIGGRAAARLLGVHENTVRNWAQQGLLTAYQLPGSKFTRYDLAEVERLRAGMATAAVERSQRLAGGQAPPVAELQSDPAWQKVTVTVEDPDGRVTTTTFPRVVGFTLDKRTEFSVPELRSDDGPFVPQLRQWTDFIATGRALPDSVAVHYAVGTATAGEVAGGEAGVDGHGGQADPGG